MVFRYGTKQLMCGGISYVLGTEIARHSFHKRFVSLISGFTETFIVVHPQRFQKTLIVIDARLSFGEAINIIPPISVLLIKRLWMFICGSELTY